MRSTIPKRHSISEYDGRKFRLLPNADARARVITMIQYSYEQLLSLYRGAPCNDMKPILEQLQYLNDKVLYPAGMDLLIAHIAHIREELGDYPHRAALRNAQQSLGTIARGLQKIDGEIKEPKRTDAPLATRTQLAAELKSQLDATPTGFATTTMESREFLSIFARYLTTFSLHQRMKLKEFGLGETHLMPLPLAEIFGAESLHQVKQTLPRIVNACIIPSPTKGLSIEQDPLVIRTNLAAHARQAERY